MATLFQVLNIDKRLQRALSERGYTEPTPIQEKVFSLVMSGADVCGIAQTGTGKTLAYLLPLLNLWKYDKSRDPQILVLVPTRELVLQVVEEVQSLTTYLGATVAGIHGGVNINTQRLQFQEGFDVLVATPGRFYDLAVSGAVKVRSVKKLVIDEVDEMLNLGFRTQLTNILHLLPQKRQNLLFSATLIEEVETLFDAYFDRLKRVEAAPAGTPVEQVTQQAFEVPNFHTKINLLTLLLERDDALARVVVFAATKKGADTLFELLEPKLGNKIGLIHSNKEQNHRARTVQQFREGSLRVLIATDIVARGIDIAGVSHVVNFDLPDLPEQYVHRIGRTGRAGERGIAITLLTPRDLEKRTELEAFLGAALPVAPLPEDLVISTQLTSEEEPRVHMKELSTLVPKKDEPSGAFHEKSAKNQKVNKTISRRERMQQKYGKPIKRGKKR